MSKFLNINKDYFFDIILNGAKPIFIDLDFVYKINVDYKKDKEHKWVQFFFQYTIEDFPGHKDSEFVNIRTESMDSLIKDINEVLKISSKRLRSVGEIDIEVGEAEDV